jgi:hypothetical protein
VSLPKNKFWGPWIFCVFLFESFGRDYKPRSRVQEMSQPEHVKDPSVEFVKSRLLGAAAEAKQTGGRRVLRPSIELSSLRSDCSNGKLSTTNS